MKKWVLTTMFLLAGTSASAGEYYGCVVEVDSQTLGLIDLDFSSNKLVLVKMADGREFELEFKNSTSQSKQFGTIESNQDLEIVDLYLPADFSISGSNAAEEFEARLEIETPFDGDKSNKESYLGQCQREDN